MKVAMLRRIGLFAVIIGGLLVTTAQVLPAVKMPQVATWSGPHVEITERSYWVDYYVTPKIDEGTPIYVELTLTKDGTVAVLAFASSESGDPLSSPVLREILESSNMRLSRGVVAGETAHYMFVVTSWGGEYVLSVRSVWSPFHELKPFTLYGFIMALGGAFTYYYSRVKARTVHVLQSVSEKSSMLRQEASCFSRRAQYEA